MRGRAERDLEPGRLEPVTVAGAPAKGRVLRLVWLVGAVVLLAFYKPWATGSKSPPVSLYQPAAPTPEVSPTPRPTTELAGSVLAEQVVLAAALALVAGILALTLGVPALVWQLLLGLVAGIAVLLLVVLLLSRVAPRTRASRAGSALRGLASGQALLRSRRRLPLAVAAGSLSWAAQVAGIWAALEGFGIHAGLGAAGAVFLASTLVQLFPFWPGNLGVFQLGVAAPLAHLYGVDAASALAFSVGLQLIEGVLGVGLGAAFLAREGLGLRSPALRLSGRARAACARPAS